MDEYIKREDLLELYRMDDPVLNENGHVPLPVIRQNIMDIPAADVVPVRYGRWIWHNKWEPFEFKYECSICHDGSDLESKYCQNCGARMDGGTDNG